MNALHGNGRMSDTAYSPHMDFVACPSEMVCNFWVLAVKVLVISQLRSAGLGLRQGSAAEPSLAT